MKVRRVFLLTLFAQLLWCCMQAQDVHDLSDVVSGNSDNQQLDTIVNFIIEKEGAIYTCFGRPCEGVNTDYYFNDGDKVKITGRFKKGVPVDTLKEYYETGVLKSLYYSFRKKYKYGGRKFVYALVIEYDENGNCVRYKDDKKGVERRYGADGVLLSETYYNRKKNQLNKYAEYYPGKKEKIVISQRNRYDYDENGRLTCYWVRKSERYNKKYGVLSATFYFREYDMDGKLAKQGRFYTKIKENARFENLRPEFPESMDAIPVQDFKEVVYPMLEIKEVYRWDFANKRTIIKKYRQEGNRWVEVERKSLPRL